MSENQQHEHFVIEGLAGKRTLSGTVAIAGSKNAALPALAASVLFDAPVTYTHVPHIEDVKRTYELLEQLDATVKQTDDGVVITTSAVGNGRLDAGIAERMRASVVFTGPLLARFREVTFPHPGGCVIGERPIDLFLESFVRMGATVEERDDVYVITAPKGLTGATLVLPVQSVTATETLMMAAALASGTTIISNAAMEPEVSHLARFLKGAGVSISGIGTPTLTITGTDGVLFTKPHTYETPPDRIETGSFLILGALCADKLHITNCLPEEVRAPIERLRRAGAVIEIEDTSIVVQSPEALQGVSVKTHEYPGFPTDLQAPIVVLLSQAEGESHIFETIFEGRLHYVDDLIQMGAEVRLISDRELLIHGPQQLSGRILKSPDIRAGLAFIIAASIAEGTSQIYDIYSIDRGYEHIEKKLQGIGLDIRRVSE